MVVGAIHIYGRRAVAGQFRGKGMGDLRGVGFLNGELRQVQLSVVVLVRGP